MSEISHTKPVLAKPGRLRWEIGLALLVKVILLTGLWFLLFRWQDRPQAKPDIAAHFALPAPASGLGQAHTKTITQETTHVR